MTSEPSLRVSVVPRAGRQLWTGPMTLAALALVACAVTRFFGLDHAGFSFCFFKAMTGYACLTCGTTRAFGHLSRLEVSSAFAIQPLITVGTLGLMIWGASDALLLLVSKRTAVHIEAKARRFVLVLGLTLAALNWMYLLAAGV